MGPPRSIAQLHVDQQERDTRGPCTDIGGDSAQERLQVVHERKRVSWLCAGCMPKHLDGPFVGFLQRLQQLSSRSTCLDRDGSCALRELTEYARVDRRNFLVGGSRPFLPCHRGEYRGP